MDIALEIAIQQLCWDRMRYYSRFGTPARKELFEVREIPILEKTQYLLFDQAVYIRGQEINLTEMVERLFVATFWISELHKGVQFLITSNPVEEEYVGNPLDIETWWPLFEKP